MSATQYWGDIPPRAAGLAIKDTLENGMKAMCFEGFAKPWKWDGTVTDPEDVLWICPAAEHDCRMGLCPCAVPHLSGCPGPLANHHDSSCPGECEPLDQFKAEEALSYE